MTLFNTSVGHPSYFSTLSSRFLSNLKRINELLSLNGLDQPMNAQLPPGRQRDRLSGPFPPLPAPWGFATSGYAIGLMAVALLLNRIQHIVVPPRTIRRVRSEPRAPFPAYLIPFLSIWSFLFPVDLSSTVCRLIFRIPSLYFLGQVLGLWTIILLQSFGLFPCIQWKWLQPIYYWAANTEMENICWSTFGAICLALCVGALTRGLEGIGTENTAPFNLFGYAFLLHVYSSPITHTSEQIDLASRPNKHVIVTIVLPLLQLSIIHFLGVKKSWSQQRLIPTTICSVLSLVHFHSIFWTSPASYPILNYFPAFLESFLALATTLACGLNILTQILLEGTVKRPIFGHAESLAPKWDEDFSIALLRLGTASLEATHVAGLGNEVGSISVTDPDVNDGRRGSFTMDLTRGGVSSPRIRGAKRGKTGFDNEIRNVQAVSNTGTGEIWVHSVWYTEFTRFWISIWRVTKGFWRLVRLGGLRVRRSATPRRPASAERVHRHSRSNSSRNLSSDPDSDEDPYEIFIRGASVSDDEDDEFNDSLSISSSRMSSSESIQEDESAGLYTDISVTGTMPTSAPVLLAHMTDTSTSPLTRRRYHQLIANSDTTEAQVHTESSEHGDFWKKYARDRRNTTKDINVWEEVGRYCVICTFQPRQIICWPCRCLALCDDCRENLASRSSASKHTCPCCRRSVEGFSRIYIP